MNNIKKIKSKNPIKVFPKGYVFGVTAQGEKIATQDVTLAEETPILEEEQTISVEENMEITTPEEAVVEEIECNEIELLPQTDNEENKVDKEIRLVKVLLVVGVVIFLLFWNKN